MVILSVENIYFVLVKPKYSGNIGFTARAIKNFGFKKLVLVDPIAKLDEEAYRYSMHAKDVLENVKIYHTIDEFVKLENINYLLGTTARVGSEKNPLRLAMPIYMIRNIDIPEKAKIAILFGNEESGLTNKDLEKCDIVLTIPTAPEYPTLNLSHAVAIIAYEFALAINTIRELPFRPADRLEREILYETLIKILDLVAEDMPEGKKDIYRGIIKNWVYRIFLTGREVHSLIGYSKLILKKLEKSTIKNGD